MLLQDGSRVALIGIDGGNWHVLHWLINEGYMPNLKEITTRGASGILISLIPPVTAPAWLSIATGLTPGETGVIDFFKVIDTSSYSLELISAKDYKGRSIWDYASLIGYNVAVLDYPLLYPAYQVNGVMISSWGGKVTTYPEDYINTIRELVGEYNIIVNYHNIKYNNLDLFLEHIEKAANVKLRVSIHTLSLAKWDLFVDVISFTDWLQHRMWHVIDSNHPLHRRVSNIGYYRRRFAELWSILDEYIGKIRDNFDFVIIVSDHGFGPHWGVLNIVKLFEAKGLIKIRRLSSKERLLARIIDIVRHTKLRNIIPRRVRAVVRKMYKQHTGISEYLDIDASLVIIPEFTIPFGGVFVNSKFSDKRDDIIKKIVDTFRWIEESTNGNVRIRYWLKEEIYDGPCVEKLPDIILAVNDWKGVVVKSLEGPIYKDDVYSPRHTGSHRREGIIIVDGTRVKKKDIKAHVTDVAPTLMYIMGLPIPSNIKGRVLREIVELDREPIHVDPAYYTKLRLRMKLRQTLRPDKPT